MRLLLLLVFVVAVPSRAQGTSDRTPLYIGNDVQRPSATVVPSLQSYSQSDQKLAQVVIPIDVFVPFARAWAVSAQTAYASVSGDEMAELNGLGDVQLAVSHVRPVGEGGVVASVLANLPTGHRTLSPDEAETAFLLGQGFYGFRLPSLGQGFNVTPGVTWAVPVGDKLSVGLGAAYQLRGSFSPQSNIGAAYDPSDEVLLTAGLDAAVGQRSSVAADLSVSFYGEDTWEGETFAPGDAVSFTAQGRSEVGPVHVRVLGRVRSRPRGEVTGLGLRFGADGTIPAQGRGLLQVTGRVTERIEVAGLVQGRYYDASDLFGDKLVVDLRLTPRVRVAEGGVFLGRFGTAFGDVEGFEVGFGVSWSL